ncbi:helix-turn-helix domain-containing protein [Verrucomicrobia bacterium S94]|nr:helix-turn-helix domain-containing protein [Verrucomicrobia bacterium S94]
MSDSVKRLNFGAYENPYSGKGIEFEPRGIIATSELPALHEAGYIPGNTHWNFPNVLSPFWRLYYNFDPGHCIELDHQRYELKPDRILLIPDHVLFHCIGEQPVRNLWFHFSLEKRLTPHQQIPVIIKPTGFQLQLIQNLAEEISSGSAGTNRIFHRSLALIHLCISHRDISWAPPLPGRLQSVIRYISEHMSEKLPNELLAARAGISIETLCRLFSKYLHTSPARYVNQIRISRAGHLLEHSDLSIDQIAEATGFPNRAYFSRVFKQVSTLSPAEFRERKLTHLSQYKH